MNGTTWPKAAVYITVIAALTALGVRGLLSGDAVVTFIAGLLLPSPMKEGAAAAIQGARGP